MMLEWLGDTINLDEAGALGVKLRDAATRAAATPAGRGRDLGGTANTDSITQCVLDCL